MEELTIGQVAQQAGIRTSALRYYERVGLMPRPRRVSGRRCYGPEAIQRLSVLQFARQAGFTIAEIQTLFNGFAPGMPPAARWRTLAEQKLEELEALIVRAQQMRQMLAEGLRCGCLRWEECVILEGQDGCQR